MDFSQTQNQKVDMQDKPVIVEGVHRVGAIGEDLRGRFLFKQSSAKG